MKHSLMIENMQKRVIKIPENQTILEALQEQYVDWMQACGGKGKCTTCKMKVLGGMTNLSRLSLSEIKFREQGRLADDERLACQCMLEAEVEIVVPKLCQLPHLTYDF